MGENKPWRSRAVKVPGLKRKTEFYIFELLALAFGASASAFASIVHVLDDVPLFNSLGGPSTFLDFMSVA